MSHWSVRVAGAAIAGAAIGALSLIVAYARDPVLTLPMDRDLPGRVASGFYPAERAGDTTFAWTGRRASLALSGLNRSSPWECSVSLRGGRSDPATQPTVDLAVDGILGASAAATNDFRVLAVEAPSRPGDGLSLDITSSATIVPGPSDSRQLGVQVDQVVCRPARAVLPPRAVVLHAALTAAAFGAAIALVGTSVPSMAGAIVILAVAQALPLSAGAAPYTGFSGRMLWLAVWIAGLSAAIVKVLERSPRSPLHSYARFVVLFSGAALYLKLLGLLHPSKLLVDAVFHAHRLEWVLAGRFFFTQPMPSGVSFPYAIGLYLFAAPWSALTRDFVMLLRVVVCAAEVIAGVLLYPLIARSWGDRKAAAIAVVLFNVVPLPYGLVGNANLTNAFGQSIALATLIVASMLPADRWRTLPTAAFFLLCSLAFLSHVSTFALLAVTLVALSIIYRWCGDTSLHRAAWTILGVAVVAALFAVVVYYGHFAEVYRTALRVRAEASSALASAVPPSTVLPLKARVADALAFTVTAAGWPILVLAVVGIWRVWFGGFRDRAVFLVAAWGVAYVTFLGVAVMRVDAPFQRYAAEFFGRVLFATYPGAVVLAAGGAAWAWRSGVALRLGGGLLVLWAVILGVQHWAQWFA
jgi:hypothetical protein